MTDTQEIVWGPAIAVDGKRPGWLIGTDIIDVQEDGNDFYGVAMEDRSVVWHDDLNAIRLPADHPHYRQPAPESCQRTDVRHPMDIQAALSAGMKPWAGGEAAPDDWDGNPVLTRIGTMVDPKGVRDAFTWGHATADDKLRMPHFDIVAYNPKPAPIDWSGELEAVHEDGRVVAVTVVDGPDHDGDRWVEPVLEGGYELFFATGLSWSSGPWRIRNVTPQPTPQADTKPDVTARMEALVREVDEHGPHAFITKYMAEEARAIVALLPEPVDPDLIEAREIVAGLARPYRSEIINGEWDETTEIRIATAAIKRGRELALAGETGK